MSEPTDRHRPKDGDPPKDDGKEWLSWRTGAEALMREETLEEPEAYAAAGVEVQPAAEPAPVPQQPQPAGA
jgi:hypothetical protein